MITKKIVGNILGKQRKRGGRWDWDGDGVPNRKDCQPRNIWRQDFVPGDRVQIKLYQADDRKWEWIEGIYRGKTPQGNLISLAVEDGSYRAPTLFDSHFQIKKY